MYRKKMIKGFGMAALILGIAAAKPGFLKTVDASAATAQETAGDLSGEDGVQDQEAKKDQDEELSITKKTYSHEFKTKQGVIYKKISYEYPVANDDSPAADAFNGFYQKRRKEWIKNAKNNLKDAKQDVTQHKDSPAMHYADEVTCEFVQNGQYISVLQSGYDYTLGAHGMPYRIAYFFKTDTGENISAAQILGISKKELNSQVSDLFWKKYKKLKDSKKSPFYNTAIASEKSLKGALKKMDFSDSCYLKNGKLRFYADPYALGPYAAGFIEVAIKL